MGWYNRRYHHIKDSKRYHAGLGFSIVPDPSNRVAIFFSRAQNSFSFYDTQLT